MKKLSEKLAFEFVQQADTQSCEHKAFKPYKIRVANTIFSNCPVCHKVMSVEITDDGPVGKKYKSAKDLTDWDKAEMMLKILTKQDFE